MLCMFQTGALQNSNIDVTTFQIPILKSYRPILNMVKHHQVAFIFTYHIISCYNCYSEIDEIFYKDLNKKYYILVPSCVKTKYPIHQLLKNAVYIFDPWMDCSNYSKYSSPSNTRSKLFLENQVVFSPSLFVYKKGKLYYFPYQSIFSDEGKLNGDLFDKLSEW